MIIFIKVKQIKQLPDYALFLAIKLLRTEIIKYVNHYAADGQRIYDTQPELNMVYQMVYSDSRYYGVNSPQPNDWFVEGNDVNSKSNFNSVTILKCVMEMCMLGASHDETGTYTLQNAGVFVSIQQTGNVKFTVKYSTVANKGDGSGCPFFKSVIRYSKRLFIVILLLKLSMFIFN